MSNLVGRTRYVEGSVGRYHPVRADHEMIERAGHFPHAITCSKSPTPSCGSSRIARMPRVGLNTSKKVVAGAELPDETGIGSVILAALAGGLGGMLTARTCSEVRTAPGVLANPLAIRTSP